MYSGFSLGVSCVAYDYTETFLFAGSLDKQAKLWSLKNSKLVASFTGHIDYINCCHSYSASQRAITGSSDKTIKEWDFKSLKQSRNVITNINLIKIILLSIASMFFFLFLSYRIIR